MCDDCDDIVQKIKQDQPEIVIADATRAAMTAIHHWAVGWRTSSVALMADIGKHWDSMGVTQMYRVWAEMRHFLPLPDNYTSPFTISAIVITPEGASTPETLPPELREKYEETLASTQDDSNTLLDTLTRTALADDMTAFEKTLSDLDEDNPYHRVIPMLLLTEAAARWDDATDTSNNPVCDQWDAHLKKYLDDPGDDAEVTRLKGLFDHE